VNHEHGTFAGPTTLFSRISMPRLRTRRFREHSGFPGTSLWSLMEFSGTRRPDSSPCPKKIYLAVRKNRIIRHLCCVMNYSDTRSISHRSYLDLYFTTRACCVFFKQTESPAAVESSAAQAERERERERERESKSQPQDQLQACSN